GVDVRVGAALASVRAGGAGVVAELEGGGAIEAEEILLAAGRKPHTAEIGLETIGVETDERGFLTVDGRMRVGGSDRLYAIGDANGRALFTHVGKYQAWIAAGNLLGRPIEAIGEALGAPRVTFTDPQVAAVGKRLADAQEAGIDAGAVDVPTDAPAGA